MWLSCYSYCHMSMKNWVQISDVHIKAKSGCVRNLKFGALKTVFLRFVVSQSVQSLVTTISVRDPVSKE